MKNTYKRSGTILIAVIISVLALSGCGGGGGGSSAPAPAAAAASGNGKIAASVHLTGRVGARAVAQSPDASVTVKITISGIYAKNGTAFPPVTNSVTFSLTQSRASVSVISVPIGVNHLLTAEADWGGAVETVKALIPNLAEGETVTVVADQASTVAADTAVFFAEKNNLTLDKVDPDVIENIQKAVASMAEHNIPYFEMQPEAVLAYIAGMNVPQGIVLEPSEITAIPGVAQQLTINVVDGNHFPIAGLVPIVTLDPSTLGTVDANGLYTPATPGSGVLTAVYDAFSATASVTVLAACSTDADCEDGLPLTLNACLDAGTANVRCQATPIACNASADCDDADAFTIDECSNGGTSVAACAHTPVACFSNLDCNDANALTIDECANGGTAAAACGHTAIACNVDLDCDDASGVTIDSCSNPSTLSASCSHTLISNAIAAGRDHACMIMGDSSVQCWGANYSGQLGTGDLVDATTPITVPGISGAVAIAAGAQSTCAVLSDGTVWCWGGSNQQVARVAASVAGGGSVPTQVSGITTAVSVALGYDYACALLSDHTVNCWGYNYYGQLGDGTALDSVTTPVVVSGISTATAISAMDYHTCALLSTGAVQCWGSNWNGELGDGTTTQANAPVNVSGISGAVSVSAGSSISCASLVNGTAYCWGYGYSGQLGAGTSSQSLTPVQISGVSSVASIHAGYSHVCARRMDDTASCWGDDMFGQIDGVSSTTPAVPTLLSAASGPIASVSVGQDFTCVILTSGLRQCFGSYFYGKLGDGRIHYHTARIENSINASKIAISRNGNFSCALASGSVQCWGTGWNGQLGNGTNTGNQETPVSVSGISTAVDVSAGYSHACAALSNGTVQCWGYNGNGELGDGTMIEAWSPVPVSGINNAIAVTAGGNHSCALLSDQTVKCWGYNGYGELGDGTTTSAATPVVVSGINNAVAIDGGGYHTCAVLSNGTINCWGANWSGQIGDGTTNYAYTPVAVSGISTAAAVSAGYSHNCALLSGGTVQCWGDGGSGQLGDGTFSVMYTPVAVPGLSNVIDISASGSTSCAALADGSASCWGNNYNRQLGDGTNISQGAPVNVIGVSGATDVSAGSLSSCAILSGGAISCWGTDFLFSSYNT